MQHHYESLSPRLQQVAELLMRDPQHVATVASRELAAELAVPPSTLTRFAKVLGFPTFKEVQSLFKDHYVARPRNYLQRVKLARAADAGMAGHDTLHRDFALAVQHSLHMTSLEVSTDKLRDAADMLASASEVWVHGIRRAYPVAVYLQYLLLKVGARASMLDSSGGFLEPSLGRLKPGGVLLVVTYSPHAAETGAVLAAAREAGVRIVGFTDPPPSALAKDMAIRFEIREGEVMGFRALCASMYVAQALVMLLAQRLAVESGVVAAS